MRVGLPVAAASVFLGLAAPASAAVITQRFEFTATDFAAYSGPLPAPTDPVTGVIFITYDPEATQAPTGVGIAFTSLNIAHATVKFTYTYLPAVDDGVLDIGSSPNAGGGFSIAAPGDYGISIFNLRTTPRLGYVQYMTGEGNYYSLTGELAAATVPEPVTWALMLSGFGLAGAGLRWRRVGIATA